jgi:hypothetical protein
MARQLKENTEKYNSKEKWTPLGKCGQQSFHKPSLYDISMVYYGISHSGVINCGHG